MQNKSFRLTDNQISLINQLANIEGKKVNHVMRELIDIGLQGKGISYKDNDCVGAVPKYEIISTSCAVETLFLLREFVKKSLPELIKMAEQLASEKLNEEDLTELVRQ